MGAQKITMLDTTVQEAATQPAQVEQKAVETKSTGKVGMNDFARMIASKQVAPPEFTPKTEAPAEKAEVKTEVTPKTEEGTEAPAEVKTEETKEEAKAETAEETEEKTEEVLSPENNSLDPKLQAILDKRIGKEVAKREKLKQRIAALEALVTERPQEVEKEVVVPVPANVPLAEITTIDQLNAYKDNLENDIVEAEMLLYSEFPPDGMDTKWGKITKKELISALTQAKKDARTAIPAREKFLTTRSQSAQTAQEKFPFLKDPTHPGYQMAKQALRDNPVLRTYPNSDYLVGMLVKGQLAMQAEEAASKTEAKATPAKPRPKPTNGQSEIASDASITRAPVGVMNAQALQVEIAKITGGKKSLGHKDFAQVLLAKQRFRNSQ